MHTHPILARIQGGLIVSCQALEHEPLHSSYIMSRMAYAAMQGGAAGIRANTPQDIAAIKKAVSLPVIGIIKKEYEDSPVYITPTMAEVDALVDAGAEIIALDATARLHPGGCALEEFFAAVREKYPQQLFMADCSDFAEAEAAQRMGFDLLGTTLAGYTPHTAGRTLPDFELMHRIAHELDRPLIAEGGIWTPQELRQAFDAGAFACVVGTAITRPMEITRRFVAAIK